MAATEPAMRGTELNQKNKSVNQAVATIDLVELLYRLLEKSKYIILAAVLGAVIAGLVTFFLITPTYTATSKLYVVNSGDSAINLTDLQIGNYLASDYQEVFSNWHVHERVIQELGLEYSYSELASMVTVSNPSDTRILYIKVISTDPAEAKAIADTYAEVAREFIAVKMETKQPNVFEEALMPSAPSSPNKTRNIMLGFMLGLILACGLVTLQFMSDDRIRTGEEIEKYLDLPTLGMMPQQVRKPRTQRTSVDKGGKAE